MFKLKCLLKVVFGVLVISSTGYSYRYNCGVKAVGPNLPVNGSSVPFSFKTSNANGGYAQFNTGVFVHTIFCRAVSGYGTAAAQVMCWHMADPVGTKYLMYSGTAQPRIGGFVSVAADGFSGNLACVRVGGPAL